MDWPLKCTVVMLKPGTGLYSAERFPEIKTAPKCTVVKLNYGIALSAELFPEIKTAPSSKLQRNVSHEAHLLAPK